MLVKLLYSQDGNRQSEQGTLHTARTISGRMRETHSIILRWSTVKSKEGSTHEALRLLASISRHCQHLATHLIQLIVQLLNAGQVVPAGMSAGVSGRLAT